MGRQFLAMIFLLCLTQGVLNCGGAEPGPGHDSPAQEVMPDFTSWLAQQDQPGVTPLLFAPRDLSSGLRERCVIISPAMTELYHQQYVDPEWSSIVVREIQGDAWTPGRVAPFSGIKGSHDCGPAFVDDGETLVFYSNRPVNAQVEDSRDYNFWSTTRSSDGWSPARILGSEINSPFNDEDVSFTAGGIAYFSSNRTGDYDIYKTQLGEDSEAQPERLGESINSPFFDGHPCVASDETFMIFTSGGRSDEIGGGDLYVSFRDSDDNWSPAVILDGLVNTASHEAAPTLSPDGQYLFFLSQREPGEGVYWVSIEYIEGFRP